MGLTISQTKSLPPNKSCKQKRRRISSQGVQSIDFYEFIITDTVNSKPIGRKSNKNKPNKGAICKNNDKIPHDTRNNVWIKYNGDTDHGICYCCGKYLYRYNAGWHCSHVVSRNKNGDVSEGNLRTCCKSCNLSMGNQNLYAYIRDKELKGPGSVNVERYFKLHLSQKFDKRTNNWGK